MGFKSILKTGLFSGLSPKRWVGYDQIKRDTVGVGQIAKEVFRHEKTAGRKETFDEAMKRFNLTEDDIKKRMKSAKQLVGIFLGFGGLLFLYLIYQWTTVRILDGFICLVLMLLVLTYAFKEHFNLFQMRHRRLGCTYKEWFRSMFKKGSK